MPLKKDKKNTEDKKDKKVKSRKETTKERSNEGIKEDLPKETKVCCIKWLRTIELILLVINLIATIILIQKVNQINKWTLLYNWWIENYNNLKTVYDSPEYKDYILNEINDLKKQLNNKEIVQE